MIENNRMTFTFVGNWKCDYHHHHHHPQQHFSDKLAEQAFVKLKILILMVVLMNVINECEKESVTEATECLKQSKLDEK